MNDYDDYYYYCYILKFVSFILLISHESSKVSYVLDDDTVLFKFKYVRWFLKLFSFSITVVFCLHFYLFFFDCEQLGENDTKPRWYSFSSLEKSGSVNQLNLKKDLFLGKRYESTAAESDASSSSPAEKFEYQAEVLPSFICVWFVSYSVHEIYCEHCFG